MKLKWLVALAVVLALVWASAVVAGPTKPAGGDPDIWERARPNNPSGAIKAKASQASSSVAIDLVVFKASIKQQVPKGSAKDDQLRRLAVAKWNWIRR